MQKHKIDTSALVKGQHQLRLFHNFPQLVYVFDLQQGKITYFNRQISDILGYSSVVLDKQHIDLPDLLVHPQDQDAFMRRRAHLLEHPQDSEDQEQEIRLRHQRGHYQYFLYKELVFEESPAGEVRSMLGIATHITQQKQGDLALAAIERGYHNVIRKALVGICVTDEKGYFEYANPIYCDIYGYSLEELTGQSFTMLAPTPERVPVWQKMHDDFIRGDDEIAGEWIVKAKDGSLRIITTDAALFEDKDGRRKKFTFVRDVTAYRNTEQELENVLVRYATLLHLPQFGVCFFNAHSLQIREVNETLLAFLGKSREELLSLRMRDLLSHETSLNSLRRPELFEQDRWVPFSEVALCVRDRPAPLQAAFRVVRTPDETLVCGLFSIPL